MSSAAATYGLSERLRDWREGVTMSPAARRVAAVAGLAAFGALWGIAVAVTGTNAVILCLAFIACVFVVRDFRAGVVLLVAMMPISQSYVFPHEMFGITGFNPLNLLMVMTIVMMVMRVAGDGSLRHLAPRSLVFLYLLPLIFGAAIGAPHVGEIPGVFHELEMIFFDNASGYVRDMLIKPCLFVVYALLVSVAVEHSERPERFIAPLLMSVWLMAGVAIGFIVLAGVSLSDLAGTYARSFLSALGMHANDLGRLYAVAYALLLFTWDRSDRIGLKTITLFSMGMVVLALLMTFSRGAFLGFILVNLMYLAARRQGKTMLLAAVLIPIGLFFMPGAVVDRVTMGWGQGADTITAGRTDEIWGPVIPELFKSPIWGNGLGAIMWSAPMVNGTLPSVAHPHNAFLEVILDLGVVGLMVVLAFWFVTWRGFRRFARDDRLAPELQGFFEGAAAGLLAFVVAGMAGSSFLPSPEQAFLWLAVGMLYGVQRKLAPVAPARK